MNRYCTILCLLVFSTLAVAQTGTVPPNCQDLNAHVDTAGNISIALSEFITNAATPGVSSVEVSITRSFGAAIYGPTVLGTLSSINLYVCPYLRETLKINVRNQGGACWSYLTMKQGNGPVLTGRSKDVFCFDPLAQGGHIDGKPPTAVIPCEGDVPATFVADWVTPYDCGAPFDPANDTAKVIYREYEAFDKKGNRGFTFDTIVVRRLPQIVPGDNAWCRERDSLYCGVVGKVGPYMIVDGPLWGDPGTQQQDCKPLFFVETEVGEDGKLHFYPAEFDEKCGVNVHVDYWAFDGDCPMSYKVNVEVKQSCIGPAISPAICNTTNFLNWASPVKWSFSRETQQQGIWFGDAGDPFRTDVWQQPSQVIDLSILKAENAADQMFIGTYNPHLDILGLTEACITIPQDGTLDFNFATFNHDPTDQIGYASKRSGN